jgi:peroxiredoxin
MGALVRSVFCLVLPLGLAGCGGGASRGGAAAPAAPVAETLVHADPGGLQPYAAGVCTGATRPGPDQVTSSGAHPAALAGAHLGLGAPAVDIAGIDATGKACALSDFKGQVILLDVSAAWCYWCQVDAPSVTGLYNSYKDRGVQVVTVLTEDANGSGPCTQANLQAWSSAYAVPFRVQNDHSGAANGTAEKVYVADPASRGFPTFVIIDKAFKVQYLQGGLDAAAVRSKLDALLAP